MLADLYRYSDVCPAALEREFVDLAQTGDASRYLYYHGHIRYATLRRVKPAVSVVTCMRHPVERVLSERRHWLSDPDKRWHSSSPLWRANLAVHMLSELDDALGSHSLKKHLESAKRCIATAAFLFDFDGLESDMRDFASSENLPRVNLRHLNRHSKGASVDVSQELYEELMEINWADLELYSFSKKVIEERRHRVNNKSWSMCGNPYKAPQVFIRIEMSDPLVGSGWHKREGTHGLLPSTWRWTNEDISSSIFFTVLPNVDYILELTVVNIIGGQLDDVRLVINGRTVATSIRPDPVWGTIFSSDVPASWLSQESYNLQLDVIAPCRKRFDSVDPKSQDSRIVGVAVSRIECRPR
jgi:hypothetical protein